MYNRTFTRSQFSSHIEIETHNSHLSISTHKPSLSLSPNTQHAHTHTLTHTRTHAHTHTHSTRHTPSAKKVQSANYHDRPAYLWLWLAMLCELARAEPGGLLDASAPGASAPAPRLSGLFVRNVSSVFLLRAAAAGAVTLACTRGAEAEARCTVAACRACARRVVGSAHFGVLLEGDMCCWGGRRNRSGCDPPDRGGDEAVGAAAAAP